jgi:CMP-N,N'-diacetyllegionaminic acid synthase
VHKSSFAVLALVTARGGSKGFPDKNLKTLRGHPLVGWAVAAGVQSRLVTRTICSTDSDEIRAAAERYGAEVPFMRPSSLAEDDTPDLPVFLHALDHLAAKDSWIPDLVVHLRPTAPLRPRGLVDESIELLAAHPEATSVRAVCPAPSNPYKMWRIPAGTDPADAPLMTPLLEYPPVPQAFNAPRQLLPTVYWQVGTVDTSRTSTLLNGSMTGDAILPLLVNSELAIDIDSNGDLERAANADTGDCVVPGHLVRWENVRMLVLDVDGTLTPGEIYYGPDGERLKRFHTHDGRGIEMLREIGVKVAIITQEASAFTRARAEKLHIDEVHIAVSDKVAVLEGICQRNGIDLASVAYVGDDLGDRAALNAVAQAGGISCAVSDARPEIVEIAHFVTRNKGGFGAVRDVCDQIRLAAVQP